MMFLFIHSNMNNVINHLFSCCLMVMRLRRASDNGTIQVFYIS